MAIRSYDVKSQLLQREEIKQARLALGLSLRGMAEILLLSPANGADRVLDWETGRLVISGTASQAIRFALAARGLGPMPEFPTDRSARGEGRHL